VESCGRLARQHAVYQVSHPTAAGLLAVEEAARRSAQPPHGAKAEDRGSGNAYPGISWRTALSSSSPRAMADSIQRKALAPHRWASQLRTGRDSYASDDCRSPRICASWSPSNPSMEERGLTHWHDSDRKSSVRIHFPGELFVVRSRIGNS